MPLLNEDDVQALEKSSEIGLFPFLGLKDGKFPSLRLLFEERKQNSVEGTEEVLLVNIELGSGTYFEDLEGTEEASEDVGHILLLTLGVLVLFG